MSLYAVFSVFEAVIRLVGVLILQVSSSDKLELYSFIVFITAIIVNILYKLTCNREFKEIVSKKICFDKTVFKNMASFLGWNMFSGLVSMGVNEGPGYFINIYLGVAVNAGLGIAKQVSSAIYSFSSNFQHAFNPQIVKSYASKNSDELFSLIRTTSIMSFYLMFVIALPFILCCDVVLDLWLDVVPPYANKFTVFIVIAELISAIGAPLWMTAHAVGNIKKYQLGVSSLTLLIIPVSWIILKLGFEPYYIYVFLVLSNISVFCFRILYLKQKIAFPIKEYITDISKSCIIPSLFCIPIPYVVSLYVFNIWGVIVVSVLSLINIGAIFFFFAITPLQRSLLLTKVYEKCKFLKLK